MLSYMKFKDIYSAVKTGGIKCGAIIERSHSREVLVVSLQYAQWSVWIISVEVVYVARERYREEILSLPQTTDLLIFYLVAHLEFTVH